MNVSADRESLPYRPCVGVALFNRDGLVWIGRRLESQNDAEGTGKWWQLPQGGIDDGEDPVAAGFRELEEETGVTSAIHLATARNWFRYDLPPQLIGKAWKGRYRGQKQLWIACRFTGAESEIDLAGGHHKAEFDAWRWVELAEIPALIVPFKRHVYEQVVSEFCRLAKPGN